MSKTKFYSKLYLLTIFFFSTSNFILAEGGKNIPTYDLVEDVQNLYLKSFFDKNEEKALQEAENSKNTTPSFDLDPTTLSRRDIRAILFNNAINFDKNWITDRDIYNKYLISDLDIYLGKNADPGFNLVSRISRTKTIIGELTLATMLARPTANIQELIRRQQAIQTLIDYKKQHDTLDKILATYGSVENNVSSLFSERDPFCNVTINNTIQDNFLFRINSFNTPKWLGSYKMLVKDYWGIFLQASLPDLTFWSIGGKLIVGIIPCFNTQLELNEHKILQSEMLIVSGSLMFYVFSNLWNKKRACDAYERNDKILQGIARRLYNVSVLLRLSKKLTEVIENDEELKKVFGDKIFYIRSLKQKMESDKNLKIIFKFLLEKHEKLRDWHYYKNNAGYILFIYNNLDLIRQNIGGAMAEVGFIDAYCSCADLFSEHNGKKNHFVFTKFSSPKQTKTPYLKFDNLWNPFLSSDVAVPNSIEMGEASATKCGTMIITGPNAGGKSTFVSSVTIAIILSQTMGIAPGDDIILTPFNKINSYIEIKDDIGEGKSAFVAEVDRSLYQYNILKNLKDDEFSFSVFDEPFRGTNPMEGAAVEYSILEKIGSFKNNLNILTTHYPIMTLLEANNFNLGFRNFKVYVKKDAANKIKFTYKIIPGKAKQSIAIDLLYQTGYKNEILKNATEIVKNPKLYETKFEDNKVSQGTW